MKSPLAEEWKVTLTRLNSSGIAEDVGLVHLGQALTLLLSIESSPLSERTGLLHLELQTSSQRTSLLECEMGGEDSFKVRWEVKEVGVHVLSSTVKEMSGGAVLNRSFFKFSVASPFHLRTRINELEGRLFVAAQLANASVEAFRVDEIRFEPAEGFDGKNLAVDVHVANASAADSRDVESSLAALDINENIAAASYKAVEFELKPRCAYQFVFEVTRNGKNGKSASLPSVSIPLGRLDIKWRTCPAGETGHLQTGFISSPPESPETLGITCEPERPLVLNEPGELLVSLRNQTSRQLNDLYFGLDKDCSDFVPIGEHFVMIPLLEPSGRQTLRFPVIPVKQGFICSSDFLVGFTDEWVKQRLPRSFKFFVDFPK